MTSETTAEKKMSDRIKRIDLYWKIEDSLEMPMFYFLYIGGFCIAAFGVIIESLPLFLIGPIMVVSIIPLRYALWDLRGRIMRLRDEAIMESQGWERIDKRTWRKGNETRGFF
jgi:hypothetical protein